MNPTYDTGFFEQVYQVVRKIPAGRVTNYGAIARYLGSPQSARMVGWALNQSGSHRVYVPAHRVLNRNGMLTGKHYFGYADTMKELLEQEGITVINDQVQAWDQHFWDPATELDDHPF